MAIPKINPKLLFNSLTEVVDPMVSISRQFKRKTSMK